MRMKLLRNARTCDNKLIKGMVRQMLLENTLLYPQSQSYIVNSIVTLKKPPKKSSLNMTNILAHPRHYRQVSKGT